MILGLYAIMDKVAGVGSIMTLANDAVAKRSFTNAVLNKKDGQPNVFQENPEDYMLVKLGTMDGTTGLIESKYEEMLEAYNILHPENGKEMENERREEAIN